MKLTAQIRLLTTPQQASALRLTLERGNAACDVISEYAFERKVFKSVALQKALYYSLKERFGLSAQFVIRCLAKVSDAYKLDKKTKRSFRKTGAIPFDSRILSYRADRKTVSIWTVEGRQTISYTAGQHHERLLQYQQGESDLAFVKGKWYLLATCDVPEDEGGEIVDALGVDLGIAQIASDSDGESFSGAAIEKSRQWYAKRRAVLQSVGTKSAKRRLKKLSKGEARFRKDTNHCISKQLVGKAKRTGRAIALEELSGIRSRTRVQKPQRSKHSSWSFFELRAFVQYKATLAGVRVVLVNPAYTSRTCSMCGHCEKANRKSQAEFVCRSCGFQANADWNASQNIKTLGQSQLTYGSEPSGFRSKLPALAGSN